MPRSAGGASAAELRVYVRASGFGFVKTPQGFGELVFLSLMFLVQRENRRRMTSQPHIATSRKIEGVPSDTKALSSYAGD